MASKTSEITPDEDLNNEKNLIRKISQKQAENSTDSVNGSVNYMAELEAAASEQNAKKGIVDAIKDYFRRNMYIVMITIGLFFTAWWLSIIIQDDMRHKWLIPTILYIFIMIRLITLYVRAGYVLDAARWIWVRTVLKIVDFIPEKWRLFAGALGSIGVMLVGSLVDDDTEYSKRHDRIISLVGILISIFVLWLTSNNRKLINWHTVIVGQLMQFIIALFVLRTKAGYDIFNFISSLARHLLGFAKEGTAFITSTETANIGMFFFTVLPAILFFIAFVFIWTYFGWVQWFVLKFASFFFWSMRVSGAEAVVAAASPFIGQGESAVLIKNFLPFLTRAEIHQVMCSGFATISGSTLVAYIGMGINPQALVSACVMSIPCSLAVSKLRYPEDSKPLTEGKVTIPREEEEENEATKTRNVLHAFCKGASLGINVALLVMANQLCIIALVAFINSLLTWFGGFWHIHELTLQLIFGYILYPVAFLMGTPRNELLLVSRLLAQKIIQNEFVAFINLTTHEPWVSMSKRSTMIATYALAGFSNLGSVGTQIGVLSQLAPSRGGDIADLVISALITGGLATFMSAAIAGMVLLDLKDFSVTS